MNPRTLPVLLLAGALGGCGTLAPTYRRPEAPVPEQWPQGDAYTSAASEEGAVSVPEIQWPSYFPDPQLREIIRLALDQNRDLRLAALNVDRARALYGVTRAELFPTVNATGTGSRQRTSTDLLQAGQPDISERYEVNLGMASWELDIFGRIRSLKDQALEEYLASEQMQRGARLALVSGVASAYYAIAADRSALALARSTLNTQEEAHRMIQRQYDSALITEIDVRRSQSQVDAARVEVTRAVQREALSRNALQLLTGGPAPEEWLPADLSDVVPPAGLKTGLSSEALLARPDILAAEHQLKAAYALIGVARASFFPRIGLTAAFGTASNELSGLFGSGTKAWTFAPSVVLPIFDARTWAANRVSQATRDIVVVEYERAIQTAFREVADTLAIRGTLGAQGEAQQALVESTTAIHRLALNRYENGIDSYLSVLDAQRTMFAAQQGWVALRFTQLANDVKMYAVLGGGGDDVESAPPERGR
ncbi:MAG: efflux transporter outer membrane subunit [Kiritimatiellae bacterium]|nr:efflux transporter outer membrane subunit [Kiritimatiellia bacterium]